MSSAFTESLLDRTILFSFDRRGFARHARRFQPQDLAVDLAGRVCLVTGANAGIGSATATALAQRGATVWLLCRDRTRGQEALTTIRKDTGNRQVHLAVVDVASLVSVRAFVERFTATRVDVLIHNAAVLPAGRQDTADGIELTLATNVVGPFLLTQLLRSRLTTAPAARVIFVSSGGMYTQRLSLEDLHWAQRNFDGVTAYAQTKRMQVVLAHLFARRWSKTGIVFHSMHPGWVDTPGVRSSIPRFWRVMRNRLRTLDEGADTVVWLAIAPAAGAQSGRFWFDRTPQPTHLLPFTKERGAVRARLWHTCMRLAQLDQRRPHTVRQDAGLELP